MSHKRELNDFQVKSATSFLSKLVENPTRLVRIDTYNIFVINLKRRVERKLSIENQFIKLGIKYKLYFGWDAREIGVQTTDQEISLYYDKPFYSWAKTPNVVLGRKGCLLSHIKILKYALNKGLSNVMIIEDDAVFKSIEIPPIPDDAMMVYLSGLIQGHVPISNLDWIKIIDFKVWELTAYIIPSNHKIWCIFSHLTKKGLCPRVVDGMYCTRIQKIYPCYLLNKSIVKQNRKFDSDVTLINKKPLLSINE